MMSGDFKIKKIPLSENETVWIYGKNYISNSEIKYEYFANDGRHFSFPDFIMKSENNEIFLFEVKSVNGFENGYTDEYKQHIENLKEFYCAVSAKLNYYFCMPILTGSTWNIEVFYGGEKYTLDYTAFTTIVNGLKQLSYYKR